MKTSSQQWHTGCDWTWRTPAFNDLIVYQFHVGTFYGPDRANRVAKFLDVGKFKYEAQKKANLARKSQKTQEIKEIKMRPNIDDHDYETKMKAMHRFIGEGDKVKVTLRFRGRELSNQQLGMDLLRRVQEDIAEIAKIEAYPRMEGRQMLMVVSPK